MTTTDPTTLRRQAGPIVKALASIGHELGRPFTMQTQPGRFRIQKTVYLLKHSGYRPAGKYSFNLYHMGPYSPDLAAAYYAFEDAELRDSPRTNDISPATLAVLRDALGHDDPFLEGLTTTLDVWRAGNDLRVALSQARSIKPHLGEDTWREVRRFLTDHPGLITRT
ncbi:MAG: hypothetical protein ACREBZ_05325 [Thermoplasmata archaeon]